jgi:hypothetical protein
VCGQRVLVCEVRSRGAAVQPSLLLLSCVHAQSSWRQTALVNVAALLGMTVYRGAAQLLLLLEQQNTLLSNQQGHPNCCPGPGRHWLAAAHFYWEKASEAMSGSSSSELMIMLPLRWAVCRLSFHLVLKANHRGCPEAVHSYLRSAAMDYAVCGYRARPQRRQQGLPASLLGPHHDEHCTCKHLFQCTLALGTALGTDRRAAHPCTVILQLLRAGTALGTGRRAA